MKIKWSKGKIFLLLILGAFAIHYLFFRAPSEAQMIAKFHDHKAEFEQLRLMLATDKNVRVIGPDWTNAKPDFNSKGEATRDLPLNVSDARLALYRRRMKRLGITSIYVSDRKHQVQFSVFGGGFADTTWEIGYAYSKDSPKPLVESAYNRMPGRDKTHYSHIQGDWYIYHRR